MVVTADTVVVDVEPEDIDVEMFDRVQAEAKSPASEAAYISYYELSKLNVSIAFCLAVFHHESTYATNPAAIVVKYDTKNPGNCRSPRINEYPVISTPRGEFVDYPTWAAGWSDLSFRLTDPTYVYVQEGRRTIQEIIERFAPATDNNVPSSYINAVVADMNKWIAGEAVAVEPRVPGFEWVPDVSEYGYNPSGSHGRQGRVVDRLIMHCTIGSNSLGWLTGAHENSVHFLDWPDGRPRAQMVLMTDAAWGAGNKEFNLRGINYEHEATLAEMLDANYWTDAIIWNMAVNAANIIRVNPGIKPDRAHVIAHGDVPDQNHYDPGPVFPWGRFLDAINRQLAGGVPPSPPDALLLPGNPFGEVPVVAGFKDYVQMLGESRYPQDATAGILSVFGYPESPEFVTPFGSAQTFERCNLLWYRDTGVPWDIVLKRLEDD